MTFASTDKTISADGRPTPAPLVMSKLRDHFRLTYLLNETQVETMVVSSSKSLEHAFSSVGEILREEEPEKRLVAFFHGLKGLLLNMGATEWASYTRAIEEQLAAGEQLDYAKIIEIMERGLVEILSYGGGTGAGGGFSEKTSPVQAK
jgi:hypothetical protein